MAYDAELLIVGCGNVLYKDDGFGPLTIQEIEKNIENRPLPDNVITIDAGTSAPYYVFSLPNDKWKKIIIIDIADFGGKPGEIAELSLDDVPAGKYQDPHSISVQDPLKELNGVDVNIIACQPEKVSSPFVEYGVTETLEKSMPKVIDMIYEKVDEYFSKP